MSHHRVVSLHEVLREVARFERADPIGENLIHVHVTLSSEPARRGHAVNADEVRLGIGDNVVTTWISDW